MHVCVTKRCGGSGACDVAATQTRDRVTSSMQNPFTSLARQQLRPLQPHYQDLVRSWPDKDKQLPIVYSPAYNISFFGIEKLHPFDSCKFQKVVTGLHRAGVLHTSSQLVEPTEASWQVLKDIHTDKYLQGIHNSSWTIAQVTELAALVALPAWLLRWRVISPMKCHVSGTMLAAALALERGWAIQIGGGMHHASANMGMGWCPFDDTLLAVRHLRKAQESALKVLYIDLDAHQGNGVERDKLALKDDDLFVLDVYNAGIFPKDDEAKPGINISVELRSGAGTVEYLAKLEQALEEAASSFTPDLVFYNAGTDVLEGDPLGRLAVDEAGVLSRDAMVWKFAAERVKAPIVMTLSGGYSPRSAAVVTNSLVNIIKSFNLVESTSTPGNGGSQAPKV